MINHYKKNGFTLLEIVVAVAIFGVIASIIFPALLQFLDMRERVEAKHQEIIQLQKTFLFMANDFRYMVNRTTKNEYGDAGKSTLLLGGDNLAEMVTLYADASLNGLNVPRKVIWQRETNKLIRLQYPVMDPNRDTKVAKQNLLDDVDRVILIVHHIEDGRDNKDDKWEEESALPELIDITITMLNGVEYRRVFNLSGANQPLETTVSTSNQSGGANNGGSNNNANIQTN